MIKSIIGDSVLLIICNPETFAGRAKKKWPEHETAFKEAGIDFEVAWTNTRNHAIEIVKEKSNDHKIICAYGGDGTVNEVLTGIGQMGFKNTLCLLPAGRGNDNAFSLRITNKIDDLVEMLLAKETKKVDCIEANDGGRYVVGIVGAGISGAVAVSSLGQSSPGAYMFNLLRIILTYKPHPMRLTIDDGITIRELDALDVAIGNGICAGNKMLLCPNAKLDDGLLDITLVGNVNFVQKLIIVSRLKKGTHIKHKKVELLQGKKIILENLATKDLPIHFMGEQYGTFPFKFVCLPKALTVLKMPDKILQRERWL